MVRLRDLVACDICAATTRGDTSSKQLNLRNLNLLLNFNLLRLPCSLEAKNAVRFFNILKKLQREVVATDKTKIMCTIYLYSLALQKSHATIKSKLVSTLE